MKEEKKKLTKKHRLWMYRAMRRHFKNCIKDDTIYQSGLCNAIAIIVIPDIRNDSEEHVDKCFDVNMFDGFDPDDICNVVDYPELVKIGRRVCTCPILDVGYWDSRYNQQIRVDWCTEAINMILKPNG